MLRSEPRGARTPVWALSCSLAATKEIDDSFSSSGYLDVSVHRVPSDTLWIHVPVTEVYSAGFPHSEISGSMDICSSPKLIAAYHVFRRLLVPRHPPYALFCLTLPVRATRRTVLQKVRGCTLFVLPLFVNIGFQVLFHSPPGVLFTFPSQYYALSVTK